MRKVWIVVANASQTKIYNAINTKKLEEVRSFSHPESRLPNHELVSDKPGRATEVHSSSPHYYPSKMSPKLREKDHFAEEIADFLEMSFNEGNFERLYVIANAPFSSLLRHHLKPHLEKVIHEEIHKDLTLIKPEEIREYLPLVL